VIDEMLHSSTAARTSGMVAAAEALGPLIEEHREALAEGPDLPRPVAEALIRAGLTQLWLPRALGGPETHPLEFVRVIEALARLDGSVAWCATISSGGPSWIAGQLAAEPMRRLLPPGAMFAGCGSGKPTGSVTRDGEGWRVNGRWTWASFSRYSNIALLMCVEHEDGTPRMTAEGRPVLRGVVLPSEKVEVLGNWDSGGLRSSGSHDITCTDAWVPDDFTTGLDMPGRQPGPLYRLPMTTAAAIASLGVPLGIAAASIDDLVTLARTKVPFASDVPLCDQENVQLEVARAKTRLLAARAFAFEAIGSLWDTVSTGQAASVEQQALVRMACWNAGEAGREVVGKMYAAAGSTAALEESRFSAQLRDVHAACQHINFATRMMVTPGRILLGLEPKTPMI